MTDRIRWEPTGTGHLAGHVGTFPGPAFQIYPPDEHSHEWLLSSRLPCPRSQFDYSSNPDKLKAVAEEKLAELVSSLGAIFPDTVLKLADDWETTAATLDGGTTRANALLDCTASFRAAWVEPERLARTGRNRQRQVETGRGWRG